MSTTGSQYPPLPLPDGLAAELAQVVTLADDYRATRAVWIACLAISLYDWGLTFSQEMHYLQQRGIGRTKVLFIVNRYWPMANVLYTNAVSATGGISDGHRSPQKRFAELMSITESCDFFRFSFAIFAIPMHATIGAILILRIYAMYGRNQKLLWVLLLMLLSELISELIIIIPLLEHMSTLALPPTFTGCIPKLQNTYTWAYWVPMAAFESALFVLAVVKSVMVAHSETNTPRVLGILLRDSVLYFGGVIAVILTNLIIWASVRQSLFNVAIGLSTTAHSILGCRMLLNIHEAVQPAFSGHTSIFATTFGRHQHSEPPIPLRITGNPGRDEAVDAVYDSCDETTVVHDSHDMGARTELV